MNNISKSYSFIYSALTILAVYLLVTAFKFDYNIPQDGIVNQHEITNSIGMRLKLIPAGSFTMGGDLENEKPRHIVQITKPFYMGIFEVTREQYRKVMDVDSANNEDSNLPAGKVTWNDAVEFCKRLSEIERDNYRLPTEAEWEYAARGGLENKKYVWGDEELPVINGINQANVVDESNKRKYSTQRIFDGYDDGYPDASPVGSFAPNGFDLYDMAGNVWERCSDWYDADYYKYSSTNDPQGPKTGEKKVMRGGGYGFKQELWVASRCGSPLDRAGGNDGFRVVRDIK